MPSPNARTTVARVGSAAVWRSPARLLPAGVVAATEASARRPARPLRQDLLKSISYLRSLFSCDPEYRRCGAAGPRAAPRNLGLGLRHCQELATSYRRATPPRVSSLVAHRGEGNHMGNIMIKSSRKLPTSPIN